MILEAMACRLPVIASDVGGNSEVVTGPELGEIVPFDDQAALTMSLHRALSRDWNANAIRAYAAKNSWENRVALLVGIFSQDLEGKD